MPNQRTRKKRAKAFKNKRQGSEQGKMLGTLSTENAKKVRTRSKLAPEPVTPKQMERAQIKENGRARSIYDDKAIGSPNRRSGPGPFNTGSAAPKGKFRNPSAPGGYEPHKKPHSKV